jgi:signal transduction histidine kinase
VILAPLLDHEDARLDRLSSLGLLDTDPEPVFDAFAEAAVAVTGEPIALISLVDRDRQWWKSAVGLPQGGGTDRSVSFCGHAIAGEGLFEVEDASRDDRFADNPLVVGEPHVIHYAGMPLVMPEGERVGTLCVIGSRPGRLDARAREAMARLAEAIVRVLLLRERDRDRQALEQARAELESANQRKNEFLALLGHELRNPLAPIDTAARILALAAEDPVRVREKAEIIARQARQLATLVDDLLDVSRLARGMVDLLLEPLALQDVIDAAMEQTAPLMASRRHDVVVEACEAAVAVLGDGARLTQVLTNLLNNAAKYTPPGGQIRVVLDVVDHQARLSVSDNGSGIPAELLPHVFELFIQEKRTPDRAQGGLGLGLALVRNLVELHGGRVTVESEGRGQGSTFRVLLPLAPAQ